MELTREGFKAFDPEKVRAFFLGEGILDDEEAGKLVTSKMKGATLLRSSIEDVMKCGLPFGPAKDLVDMLKEKFPGKVSFGIEGSCF